MNDAHEQLADKDFWKKNPEEAKKIYDEVSEKHAKLIQEGIDEKHRRGEDIPDEIKD